jgi:hypothetical protein
MLKTAVVAVRLFGVVALLLTAVPVASAARKTPGYQTAFDRWRAADAGFAGWSANGVSVAADGSLHLEVDTAATETDPYPPGGYDGHNFYTGGSYLVGEATSPEVGTSLAWKEAIASWNAATPPGTWVEMQMRARFGARWTKWYNLGIWAADTATVERHSVNLQGDADGFVAVDTLVLTDKHAVPDGYQAKVRLFSADGAASPTVQNVSVALSSTPDKAILTPGNPSQWNRVLSVPECSQMVYPDGGEVWCSPTSVSMVLAYWENYGGPCEPRVRAAVEGVFDWRYDGHGNWPFNTAYAATQGLEGYVARFASLAEAEPWIAAGVPVVMSYPWKKNSLIGAPIPSSNGHLAVLVGFDAAGNPVINDPAAASDAEVQRTYNRTQLETLWLENSGGTVYLIYPPGHAVPGL